MENHEPIFKYLQLHKLTENDCSLFIGLCHQFFSHKISIERLFHFSHISFIANLKCFHDFPGEVKAEINRYLDLKEKESEAKHTKNNQGEDGINTGAICGSIRY
jgi:hypothetical protein